jgi:glyoxylase-like metal-dependent hydrolase (beta-lactamase superfamily II)
MDLPAITLTGAAQKSAWSEGVLPPVERIADGVWSIPVPIPDNPMRFTLTYLLRSSDAAVVIDPGWDSNQGWDHLVEGLKQADVGVNELTGIIVTHYHSDHLGMADRLRDRSGAWVALGAQELRRVAADEDAEQVQVRDFRELTAWGVPESRLSEVGLNFPQIEQLRNLAAPDLRLDDGQRVRLGDVELEVVTTPGHSPGHVCLVDAAHGLIFSGDHVLPRITPNISLELPGLANPLQNYYTSLERIAFEDAMEVCPAHEYRFVGMQRRVAQLLKHNRDRSQEVLDVLSQSRPRTVWELTQHLTWSRGWDSLKSTSMRLALCETASHVMYLKCQGADIELALGSHDAELVGDV